MELTPEDHRKDGAKRFNFDRGLLAALVDRWRPETHTFHLPCGEMAPTLEDVSYLFGLPSAGAAVCSPDVPPSWRQDLVPRFEAVVRRPGAPVYHGLPGDQHHGPTKKWLLQFQVYNYDLVVVFFVFLIFVVLTRLWLTCMLQADYIHPDADEAAVARHLEAYLLWLFGWILFTSSHGNSVGKELVAFARQIADAPADAVPQYSWASAVLAATYRGLCDACTKVDPNAVLTGCPLLLQLWAYERFSIGRPIVDTSTYGAGFYGQMLEDGPTMGTLWCRRRVSKEFYMHMSFSIVLSCIVATD